MMTLLRILLLNILLSPMLVACGQRGPLYLPNESAPVAPPARASQPAALPPDPMDTGFEDVNETGNDQPEGEQPEDEPADGL